MLTAISTSTDVFMCGWGGMTIEVIFIGKVENVSEFAELKIMVYHKPYPI